jgi:hypothetical protein
MHYQTIHRSTASQLQFVSIHSSLFGLDAWNTHTLAGEMTTVEVVELNSCCRIGLAGNTISLS